MDLALLKSTLEARGVGPFTAANHVTFMLAPVNIDDAPVPRRKFKMILVAGDTLDAAMATPLSGASAARKAAQLILSDVDFSMVDLSDAKVRGAFSALQADGTITQAQLNSIIALRTISVPRWKGVGLDREVDAADVTRAAPNNIG